MIRGKMALSASILTAVIYAAQFSYPLTEDELVLWLPFAQGYSDTAVRTRIRRMVRQGVFKRNPPFLFFPSAAGTVSRRVTNQEASQQKWRYARAAAAKLAVIPWVRMIGVTGALSMDNSSSDDDIDFCIVTDPGSVWTVRFLTTALFTMLGIRRKPGDVVIRDRICLNMYLSSSSLNVPVRERDFYTAHEVLQLTPVYERDNNVYREFLTANRWAARYLPRAWNKRWKGKTGYRPPAEGSPVSSSPAVAGFAETALMRMQRWYMKNRVTREVVSRDVIRFHPKDARSWIRTGFAKTASRFGIPLTTLFPDHKIAVTS